MGWTAAASPAIMAGSAGKTGEASRRCGRGSGGGRLDLVLSGPTDGLAGWAYPWVFIFLFFYLINRGGYLTASVN